MLRSSTASASTTTSSSTTAAVAPRDRASPPWPRRQLAGPRRERVQVRGAEPRARAGEQAHEGVAAGRVVRGLQEGDQVDHLGRGEQPAEPDDLDRQPGVAQGTAQRSRTGTACGTGPRP